MILQLKIETSPGVYTYKPLDVFDDFEVTYNHQFEDYRSLSGRKIPYSTKFKIPTTPNNRVLCGIPIDGNYPASRDVDGKMYYSSGLLAFNFIASIEGQVIGQLQPYIEISIIDIISKALADLGKWKMSEFFDEEGKDRRYIDLHSDAYVFGQSNNTSIDEMVLFPFYNFNNKESTFAFDPMRGLNQLQPTFQLSKLVKNIFSYVGLDVSSDFLTLDNQLFPGINANELGIMIPSVLMTSDSQDIETSLSYCGNSDYVNIYSPRIPGVPSRMPTSPRLKPSNFIQGDDYKETPLKFNYDWKSDGDDYIESAYPKEGKFCSTVKGKVKLNFKSVAGDQLKVYLGNMITVAGNGVSGDRYVIEAVDNSPSQAFPNMDVMMVMCDSVEETKTRWAVESHNDTVSESGANYSLDDGVKVGVAFYGGYVPKTNEYGDQEYYNGLLWNVSFFGESSMEIDVEANKAINVAYVLVPQNNSTLEGSYKVTSGSGFLVDTIALKITQGYVESTVTNTTYGDGLEREPVVSDTHFTENITVFHSPESQGNIPLEMTAEFLGATEMPPGLFIGEKGFPYDEEFFGDYEEYPLNTAKVDMVETMKSIKDYKLIDVIKMITQRFNLKFYSTSDGVIHLDSNENRLSGEKIHVDHLTDTGVDIDFTDNEVGVVNIMDSNPSFYDQTFNRLDNLIVSDTKREEVTLRINTAIVNEKMFNDVYDESSFDLLAVYNDSNYWGTSDREQIVAKDLKPMFSFLSRKESNLYYPINNNSTAEYDDDLDFEGFQLDANFFNSFKDNGQKLSLKATSTHQTGFKLVSFKDDKMPSEPRNLYMQTWFKNIMDRVNDESVIASPDLYVSEATLKILMDFPVIIYKGEEWEYLGLNSYPLSNKYGGMTSIKLVKKNKWTQKGVPNMPLNHRVTSYSQNAIVEWDEYSDDVAVTGYRLYKDGYLVHTENDINTRSYEHTNVSNVDNYLLGVSATDGDKNESDINWIEYNVGADTEAPNSPAPVSSSESESESFRVHWTEPLDNYGVNIYRIYLDGTAIADVNYPSLSYVIRDLNPGTTYTYGISALDSAGNESVIVSGTEETVDIPLEAPTNFIVTSRSNDSVSTSWDTTDYPGVDLYRVSLGGVFVEDINTSQASYVFSNLQSDTKYVLGVSYVVSGSEVSDETIIPGSTRGVKSFTASETHLTEEDACYDSSRNTDYRHNGSGSYPNVGDTVTRTNGVNVVNGFYNTNGSSIFSVLNGDGIVSDVFLCS